MTLRRILDLVRDSGVVVLACRCSSGTRRYSSSAWCSSPLCTARALILVGVTASCAGPTPRPGPPVQITLTDAAGVGVSDAVADVREVSTPDAEAHPDATNDLRVVGVAMTDGRTCVVIEDGSVRCWGAGEHGELGFAESWSSGPLTVPGLTDVGEVSICGTRSCARLQPDGSVRCWGANDHAVLGFETASACSTPLKVPGVSGAVQLASGYGHSCALLSDHTVRCWGDNDRGQLGNASATGSSGAARVVDLRDVVSIAGGGWTTCALLRDRTVRCWGDGTFGQLGFDPPDVCTVEGDAHACSRRPRSVPGLADVVSLALSHEQACAARADGTVFCWGRADESRLGVLGADQCNQPRYVPGFLSVRCERHPRQIEGLAGARSVAVAPYHACALLQDGSVRCWGRGLAGQLGSPMDDGRFASCPYRMPGFVACPPTYEACPHDPSLSDCAVVPRPVAGVVDAVQIVVSGVGLPPYGGRSCVVTSEGRVRCWGSNFGGLLGVGTDHGEPAPVTLRLAPDGPMGTPKPGCATGYGKAPLELPQRIVWEKSCRIHRPCPAPKPLLRCAGPKAARDLADLLRNADALDGQAVVVRGPLHMSKGGICTAKGCGGPGKCCNGCNRTLYLGPANEERGKTVSLSLGCGGDDSASCCPMPTSGNLVVVTGIFSREKADHLRYRIDLGEKMCRP